MEEKKMILNMLAEGKISAEEAEKLLYAVGSKRSFSVKNPMKSAGAPSGGTAVKVPSTGYKMAKFFDRVVQRIKTADFDLNFGPSEAVHYVFSDSHVMFQHIDVEVYNGSITMLPWDRNDVQIECDAHVYKVPEGSSAKTKFRNETFYDCDATKLRFYSRNKHQKVNAVISIPRYAFDDIKLATFNGSIKLSDCEASTLHAKATIGSISIAECRGTKFKGETANGTLTVKDCRFDEADAETMNGALRLTLDAKQVRAETMNGSIYCRLASAAEGSAYFKTVTGKIEAELPGEMEIDAELKTMVGGFVCDFDSLEVKEEKKEVAKKYLSFIANKGSSPQFKVEAEAKTGSISLLRLKEEH
ncbi:DUF4097 family beta strand repeat-containing protein [Fictibacillus iocasae]|uniref:DUF4097 family beta strand repeat-containing protein n=1 Tax=Fictibacillus iocasae TaxID=2715437 RepID=A0ABW2NNS2_9BACL